MLGIVANKIVFGSSILSGIADYACLLERTNGR
jgi:hypothetical protein